MTTQQQECQQCSVMCPSELIICCASCGFDTCPDCMRDNRCEDCAEDDEDEDE